MKKIVVSNCHHCPFISYLRDTNYKIADAVCIYPDNSISLKPLLSYARNYKSPKDCPLKKNSLQYSFKK